MHGSTYIVAAEHVIGRATMVRMDEAGKFQRQPQRVSSGTTMLKVTLAALAGVLGAKAITPATAQTPRAIIEKIDSESDAAILMRAQEALKDAKRGLESLRQMLGNSEEVQKAEKIRADTEQIIKDPAYIAGLRKIERKGGDLARFVGHVPPLIIVDPKLDARLARIPEELITRFQMNQEDLDDSAPQTYALPGFIERAKQFANNEIFLYSFQLKQLLELEAKEETRGISDIAIALHKRTNGKLAAAEFIWRCRDSEINCPSFKDADFMDGIVDLVQRGMDIYDLKLSAPSASAFAKLEERVKDPVFRDVYVTIKGDGSRYVRVDHLLNIPTERYQHRNFLKNIREVRAAGYNISEYEVLNYSAALTLDDLGKFIREETARDKMWALHYANEIATGTDGEASWRAVLAFLEKNSGNLLARQFMYSADGPRLSNPLYNQYLEQAFKELQGRPEAERGKFEPYRLSHDTDEKYLREKTGKGLLDIFDSLQVYSGIMNDPQTDPLVKHMLARFRDMMLYAPARLMDERHNGSAESRLEALSGFDANTILQIMLATDERTYLSTFRLMYNGNGTKTNLSFTSRVEADFGSLYSFLLSPKIELSHQQFAGLLERVTNHNLTDVFLSDIGDETKQREILTRFLFDSAGGLQKEKAISLDDLVFTTKSEPIRNFVLDSLRTVADGAKTPDNRVAGLLIAHYFKDRADRPEWAQPLIEMYAARIPEIKTLEPNSLFQKEGDIEVNTQHFFFYDDRRDSKGTVSPAGWDGHHSFKNFIQSLNGNVDWNPKTGEIQSIRVGGGYAMKEEGRLLVISQFDAKTKRRVVMYVNRPDMDDAGVAEAHSKQMGKQVPQIVVHRGHSYHAPKTINVLRPGIALVNFGSCGGSRELRKLAEKLPASMPQTMGTRRVGTMRVNDAVIAAINRELLRNGRVDWAQLSETLERYFRLRDRQDPGVYDLWKNYTLPHQNRIAHLTEAIEVMLRQKK